MHPPRNLTLKLSTAVLGALALTGCGTPVEEEKAAREAGGSWILVKEGERPAEEQPAVAAVPKKEEEHHLPKIEPVPAEPHDPRCTGATRPGEIAALAVEPGATTATVTWYHPGDPTVTSYRVTSLLQRSATGQQPDLVWQEKKPGDGCHELTATVTGLQRNTPYVFSVDAVRSPTWANTTRAATVARSAAVSTS